MSAALDLVVTDVVPVGVVVDPSSISDGGGLIGADPVTGGGTITWDAVDLPGPLAPGGSVDLGVPGLLAPSEQLAAAALVNRATVRSYESLTTGGRVYSGAADHGPCHAPVPPAHDRQGRTRPRPGLHRSTLPVAGHRDQQRRRPAFGIDVRDTLPAGWEYVDGTARVVRAGGAPLAIEPAVAGQGPRLVRPGYAGRRASPPW